MNTFFKNAVLVCSLLPTYCLAHATLVPAKTLIPDVDNIVADASKKADMPLVFPSVLPKDKKLPRYFLSGESLPNHHYGLNVDTTADCHGVKVCNVGAVIASKGDNPQIYHDRNNRKITVPVTLANHVTGYYTPGHAMGDFFPARIEWRKKDMLYSIIWQLDDKQAMIKMANSAR